MRLFSARWLGVLGLVFLPASARAHELGLAVDELVMRVGSIEAQLDQYEQRPPVPQLPRDRASQRRALGEAEVEQALGNRERAARILIGRIEDPEFQRLPEYPEALLLASEVFEADGELAGAMAFAEDALRSSTNPQQAAESAARWFSLARETRRFDRRLELYELWQARGGDDAAGTEEAARVHYEVGFALRDLGRHLEARQMLAKVPSESAFGSRAAYLAGALHTEDGNLDRAEKWFTAVMDWPVPELEEGHPQLGIERHLRHLAALSTARLRYERGDLEAARAAYARVPNDSPLRREACWELAYLETERGQRRAALGHVRCVEAHGVSVTGRVDLELLESSLLAHLNRYADSITAYERLHEKVVDERDLVASTFEAIEAPAEVLFSGMDRSKARGDEPSPGPATLFSGAWTPEVARAYRVDRGISGVSVETEDLGAEIAQIREVLRGSSAFQTFDLRADNLERLEREIDHLSGHAGQMKQKVRQGHAGHDEESAALDGQLARLKGLRARAQAQKRALDGEAEARRAQASAAVAEIERELSAIRAEAERLRGQASEPVDSAARAALDAIVAQLDDAAMRAEVGVLDTYWLKKQHRTRKVEALLQEQGEVEREMETALEELD